MHNLQTNPPKSSFNPPEHYFDKSKLGELKKIHHAKSVIIYSIYHNILAFLNDCFFFVIKAIGIILLKIFYNVQVENRGRIPLKGPLVVVANHFSYMDPIVLQSVFPRRISFMMTELYYEGRGKWLFKLLRCICVKENGSNIAALKAGIEVLRKSNVLGIFPEGGVSKEGRLQEGNLGVGFLAGKSGASVIPAFISGTYEALPKGAKIPKISKIKVIFGSPMTFKKIKNNLNKKGIAEITRQIMDQIKELSF